MEVDAISLPASSRSWRGIDVYSAGHYRQYNTACHGKLTHLQVARGSMAVVCLVQLVSSSIQKRASCSDAQVYYSPCQAPGKAVNGYESVASGWIFLYIQGRAACDHTQSDDRVSALANRSTRC